MIILPHNHRSQQAEAYRARCCVLSSNHVVIPVVRVLKCLIFICASVCEKSLWQAPANALQLCPCCIVSRPLVQSTDQPGTQVFAAVACASFQWAQPGEKWSLCWVRMLSLFCPCACPVSVAWCRALPMMSEQGGGWHGHTTSLRISTLVTFAVA